MSTFRHALPFLCLALVLFRATFALNVLAVFPYTGKSHYYGVENLLDALPGRGHSLTYVGHFPSSKRTANRTDVLLGSDMSMSEDVVDLNELDMIPSGLSMVQVAVESEFLYSCGVDACNSLLENPRVKELLGEKFDIALVEMFNSDCALGLTRRLGIPAVGFAPDTLMPWHYARLGISSNPSYVPCHNLGYGTRPSFWQRVSSTVVCGLMRLGYRLRSVGVTGDLLKKHLNEDPAEDRRTVEVLLINSYFPLSGAFGFPPNAVEVGGVHVKPPKKLPQDLETYINESPSGVIYFSLGSMIKATSISKERLAAMQQVFSGLPQRVLWKWENDTMDGKPDNVMIRKWLPQMDILSHPNVKAFISHAGMLGTTEAAHCGVPVVCIPLFGDQFANAAAAQESGLGVTLHYKDITKATFSDALARVLGPSMQKSAKRLSAIWRDRPQPPLETAVYWIEHVARHGGDHLRPASVDLPLVQYLLLDVLAFFALVAIVVAFVTYKMLLFFVRVCRGSNRKTKRD